MKFFYCYKYECYFKIYKEIKEKNIIIGIVFKQNKIRKILSSKILQELSFIKYIWEINRYFFLSALSVQILRGLNKLIFVNQFV